MDKIKDFAVNSVRWLSLEDFEGEVWKDVIGYEGAYQVSNYGRVKSLERKILFMSKYGEMEERMQYARIKKINDNGRGYKSCPLLKDNKQKMKYIHIIVAQAFIPNLKNLPQINHKDENKANNCVDNLEWCDARYNVTYGTARKRHKKTRRENGNCRQIDIYDLKGNLIKSYDCAYEMERDGYNRRAAYNVCNHRSKTYKGLVFRFKDDPFSLTNNQWNRKKSVFQYKDGVLIKEYKSIKEAESGNGLCRNRLYSDSYAGTRNPIINGFTYVIK